MKLYLRGLSAMGFAALMCMVAWLGGQTHGPQSREIPGDQNNFERTTWVEQTLASMSLEEKIGQLFMVATFSNRESAHEVYIERMVREQHLGGLIFMQGSAERQLALVNRYQQAARVPLFVAQDAEWGAAMRLVNLPRFPYQMTLGALRNDSLLYYVGQSMARELKAVGVNTSFSPVADVNNNARNPVINYRSFGENRFNVARKSIMMTQGLQKEGVMACAKHFPGHGDTESDSHYDLPVLYHSRERLDSVELYPFVKLAQQGVQSMMVAHLFIPSLDNTPNQASSLSPKIVQGLIREKMNFKGLIFTDALNMKGVSQYYPSGKAALQAFKAGNDILLFPTDIPLSARTIKQAIESGEISMQALEGRVRRILTTKYQLGLPRWKAPAADALPDYLAHPAQPALRKQLYEAAMTLVKNEEQLVPLRQLENRQIAYVQIGGGSRNAFDQSLLKYGDVKPFYLRKDFTPGEQERMLARLKDYNTVIIGLFGMRHGADQQFGVNQASRDFCKKLVGQPYQTILTVFGNPYALQYFGEQDAILMAYESVPEAEQAAAAAIFGGIRVDGILPVTASPQFPEGTGILLPEPIRFGFSLPEEQGMDSRVLNRIDAMAEGFIQKGDMPGCAILVMRGNNVVYEKGFGRMEFLANSTPIDPYQHTYDVASVTKVAATSLLTMQLVERGQLDLDAPISRYLPELKGTSKATLTIRRLMQHNAGLRGWYPFYAQTMLPGKKKSLDPQWYSSVPGSTYSAAIGPGIYGRPELKDWVWQQIVDLEVRKTTRVRYSDLGFIILCQIIERETGRSLDWLAEHLFYRPMGMNHTYFHPHRNGNIADCPPTEMDTVWRQSLIQGYVHDPAAALMGGVSGHAGLFANVYDLGKLMLMLKNRGSYGGERFLNPLTIDLFTKKQLDYSRKGLGWDKPEFDRTRNRRNPASDYASAATFGHTGFTGTCVWVDPVYDLVYVFLSNRTYPWASNRLLIYDHVREKLMDQMYESIFSYRTNFGSDPLEWRRSTARLPVK